MTEETALQIPSDLAVAYRTPIDLTEDGKLQAIQINGDKHQMVVVFHERGGVAVLGGLTMREIQKPSDGEFGARKMIEIYKVIEGLDIRGIDDISATAVERLHAAVLEYREFVEHVRSDIPQLNRWIEQQRAALTKISKDAIVALGLRDEMPHEDAAGDHAMRVVGALRVWQQGAAHFLTSVLGGGGEQPALAAPGALREIVTSGDPLPFWSHLRAFVAELQGKATRTDTITGGYQALRHEVDLLQRHLGEKLGKPQGTPSQLARMAVERLEEISDDAGAAAQVREIRQVLEEFQGRTPDPARSTVQLAREVVAQAERLGRDAGAGGAVGDAELAAELLAGAADLEELGNDAEARRESTARLLRKAASRLRLETDVEMFDRLERSRPASADQQVIGAVKQVLGDVEVRLHKPGAGILRIIVPATVPTADADAALELLRSVVPATVRARIELEPGKPPEGYTMQVDEASDGENPSSPHIADGAAPTRSWSVYGWRGDGEDAQGYKSEAAAVDGAWEHSAEGEELARDADAEGLAGE